jgi:hypothetical protein
MELIAINQPKVGVTPYLFAQTTPLSTWDVPHNLNRVVQVTVVDSNNEQVLVEIAHLDLNNIEIRFGSPVTGQAFIL